MAGLFVDDIFHIGADEVSFRNPCDKDNLQSFEKAIIQHILSIGKIPMGWQEMATKTESANPETTILDAWIGDEAPILTSQGYKTVNSYDSKFYLDMNACNNNQCYYDIARGMNGNETKLLLGGETSMWTDNYCYIRECFEPNSYPVAYTFYSPEADNAFINSVAGRVWPSASVAAGAFWNYQNGVERTQLQAKKIEHNQKMMERGIIACNVSETCGACQWISGCDGPYTNRTEIIY